MNAFLFKVKHFTKWYENFCNELRIDGEARKIATNTAWIVLEKIIRLCTNLFLVVLVARYLKPEQYGIYNYSLSIVIILSGFADLGLNQIVVRELAKKSEDQQEIVSTTFALKSLAGILFLALVSAIALFSIRDGNITQLLVLILSIRLLFKPAEAIDFFFQSKVLSKYTAYSRNVACLASAVAITAAIFQNCSILTIAVLSNLEFAISATLTLIFYLWKGYKLSILSVSWQRAIALLKDSWPLILSGIAIIIYMRIDQVMIKLISGDTELGIYSAAVRLTEAFYLIPTAIVGSTLPKITQASEESKELLYSELQSLYKVVALISYISIFFTSILAKPIISIMYGDDYLASVPILRVLIWTILFVNLGIAQHSFIVIMNWTSLYMKIVFLASFMNILLNYLLIPDYGAIGATIATIFSCWFVTHGACFIYKPLNKTGEMTTKALTLMS